VAFVRGGAPQVYILGADGSGLHPVTTVAGGGYTSPSWSPSGNELVLAVGLAGVYLVRPDGSDLHAIYRPTGRLAHGFVNWTAWSPDGEHILFGLYPINGRDEVGLFTIRPDGSGLRELMAGPIGGPAAWSPDSKKIVVSVSGGLQLMNADGSHRVQLTPAGPNANDFWPTWSPDGNLIAFTRQITTEQIWVMNADGTGQHALTSGLQSDQPAWRP
jgi:Tol biopolymer transport system component